MSRSTPRKEHGVLRLLLAASKAIKKRSPAKAGAQHIINWVPAFAGTRDSYLHDERGAVTVFILIMFTFLLAFGGLIFDVGRLFNIHSQSQAYADDVALAAAAELDGQSGAVSRAILTVTGNGGTVSPMVDAGSRLSLNANKTVGVQNLIFMSAIAADPTPGTRSPIAGDTQLATYDVTSGATTYESGITSSNIDAKAHYVLVTTTQETENYILFPIAKLFFGSMPTSASVQPQAIAGFKNEICNYPPMFICNPYESCSGGGSFTPTIGQQINLKNSSSFAPGNFGFLDLSNVGSNACKGGGANLLRCMLAVLNTNTQCISNTLTTDPGNKSSADTGVNVRFDIFNAPFNSPSKAPAGYATSANVTTGLARDKNACGNGSPISPTTSPFYTEALPRDPCIIAGNCPASSCGGGVFGNGVTQAQLQSYWTTNHGGTLPAGLATRYDVYRYEINHNSPADPVKGITNKSSYSGNKNNGGENGNAICAASANISSSATNDPRVLNVAVVNCIADGIGGKSTAHAVAFARVFLTEWMSSSSALYAEVIGVDKIGNNTVLHQFPVLFR